MAYCNEHQRVECDSCLESIGFSYEERHTPATGRSKNPEWSGYDLCAECIAEYDSRPHMGLRE